MPIGKKRPRPAAPGFSNESVPPPALERNQRNELIAKQTAAGVTGKIILEGSVIRAYSYEPEDSAPIGALAIVSPANSRKDVPTKLFHYFQVHIPKENIEPLTEEVIASQGLYDYLNYPSISDHLRQQIFNGQEPQITA